MPTMVVKTHYPRSTFEEFQVTVFLRTFCLQGVQEFSVLRKTASTTSRSPSDSLLSINFADHRLDTAPLPSL
jgi:hypothetical protein